MPYVHDNILEAEDFYFKNGFEIWKSTSLLGPYLYAPKMGQVSMWTTADDNPGIYDLIVYYYDENNGRASSKINIDGKTVANWVWNQDLGSSIASAQTYTSRVVPNVTIRDGSKIEIIGEKTDLESLRIDKVVLAPPASRTDGTASKAFSEAEGFGSDTPGGRGGWIVKVTNLDDSGVGSLRWALEDLDVPRIVVFDVGGVIELDSEIKVRGDVTVAGQTAPGDGITIRDDRLVVVDDNVIIRGLKFRPGARPGADYDLRDGISIGYSKNRVENVVIDHNSFSWSVDELLDVWYGARNITISNNIFAEGLRNAGHSHGNHSMAMLIGRGANNISVVNNLFMSNEFRNPSIAEATNIEYVNNYVYNYGQYALQFTMRDAMFTKAHLIGNYFERGPSTGIQKAIRIDGDKYGGAFYVHENISDDRPDLTYPEWSLVYGPTKTTLRYEPIFTPSDVSAMSPFDVPDYVLANAGARAQGLDKTDARLIAEAMNGGGSLKNAPPADAFAIKMNNSAPLDTDGDGVPDAFEFNIGSNPNIFNPHDDSNKDGYSNIENYINSLIPTVDLAESSRPAVEKIEAESMLLVKGFWKQFSYNASGKALLKAKIGDDARADHVFKGPSGKYDLTLRYVDENDGVTQASILRNGATLDQWLWNKDLGSDIVSRKTFDERTLQSVALKTGDVISLLGRGDGDEPPWMDYLVIAPSHDWG